MGDNRNIILAVGISAIILIPYWIFVLNPYNQRLIAERQAEQSVAVQTELTELAADSNAAATQTPAAAEQPARRTPTS